MRLTGPAARTIRRQLRLKNRVPAGAFGRLNLDARQASTDLDPYFAQCGISATTRTAGTLPPATPLPDMTGATPLADTPAIAWGFKRGFRTYIKMFDGTFPVTGGAGRDGADPLAGFTFPTTGGAYRINDPADPTDDQAVVNGKGTAIFCNPKHQFRIAISNPTVVIDGANSRIVADIDLNYFGTWTPAQRVDLGMIKLDDRTPFYNRSGAEVTWSDLPVTLTEAGAQSLCVPENDAIPAVCLYSAGDELDPLTVTLKTGVAQPFPLTSYCDYTGSTNTERIEPNWPETPALPLSAAITGAATADAGFDWGVKQGMRGMNPFNPIAIATSPGVTPSNPSDMTGPGKFFTWPGSTGAHDPAGPGRVDDRLVQRFKGTVGLCSKMHGFGTVISDPTVVIDGDASRVSADVAVRVGEQGDWIRGRVDLVGFKASEATVSETPVSGGTRIEWTVPTGVDNTSGVLLGEQGATLLKAIHYNAGTGFQGLTVRATVPGA